MQGLKNEVLSENSKKEGDFGIGAGAARLLHCDLKRLRPLPSAGEAAEGFHFARESFCARRISHVRPAPPNSRGERRKNFPRGGKVPGGCPIARRLRIPPRRGVPKFRRNFAKMLRNFPRFSPKSCKIGANFRGISRVEAREQGGRAWQGSPPPISAAGVRN